MALTEREEIELLQLLEIEVKEREKASAMADDAIFCEKYIKIVNKQGEQVPFKYNSIQKKIDDKIKELEAKGMPARLIILKARQEGVSTYTQAKYLCGTAKNKNRTALIVAHRDDSTNTIFEKSKYMYENLPEDIKPLKKASNARELIFDIPTYYKGDREGLNSRIKVQTAGRDSIGRTDTHFYVHLSEFAFYEGNPKTQLSGILQSVPNIPGTIVIIESTANGYNDFKEIWDAAEAGESGFIPMFFAWHDYEEYQMPCTAKEYKKLIDNITNEKLRNYLLGTNNIDGTRTPGIIELYGLSKEQVKWYLWTLKHNCNNDLDMMKQENPSYPKEAFLSTGRPVFDIPNIEMRIEQLKKEYEKSPPKRGRFTFEWNDGERQDFIKDDTIRWVDDPNGFITIYEDAQEGYPYVIGGDTKGEGKDFFADTVINNATGLRAAVLHMQVSNSKPYTWQTYCLGRYYNDALIGIEINFNTAPVEELQRLKYPKQYMRQQYDKIQKKLQEKFGWKTDGNTRPLIIDKEIDLIENNIELFTDITMLTEASTFVYDENNRPDAQSGKHDDVLFSDMIANEIRSQQTFDAKDKPKEKSIIQKHKEKLAKKSTMNHRRLA